MLCPDVSAEALMFPNHKGKEFSSGDGFMRARIYPITQRLGIPNSAMNFRALRRAAVVPGIALPNQKTVLSMNLQSTNEDHVGEFLLYSAMPNSPTTTEKETTPEAMPTGEKNVSPHLNAVHSSREEDEQVSIRGMMRSTKDMDVITKDPAITLEVPDIATQSRSITSRDQIITVLSVLKNPRDRCMFALVAFCRLIKSSNLFVLRWSAYQNGQVRLSPSSRPLSVPECIQDYIAAWRALCPDVSPESLMFPNSKGKAFSDLGVFLAGRIFPASRRVGIPDGSMGFMALQRAAAVRSFPRHGDPETALSLYLCGKDNAGASLDPGPRKNAAAAAPPSGE